MATDNAEYPVYHFETTNLDATELEQIKWVYQNMGIEVPKSAPTEGAMSMLMWARKEPDKFYAIWKQAAIGKQKEATLDPEEVKQRKRTNRDLKKRLKEIIG